MTASMAVNYKEIVVWRPYLVTTSDFGPKSFLICSFCAKYKCGYNAVGLPWSEKQMTSKRADKS